MLNINTSLVLSSFIYTGISSPFSPFWMLECKHNPLCFMNVAQCCWFFALFRSAEKRTLLEARKLKSILLFISFECTMRHITAPESMNINFHRINFSQTALCNWLLQKDEKREFFFQNSKETRHQLHTCIRISIRFVKEKKGSFFLSCAFTSSPKKTSTNIFRLFSNYHT